MPNHKLHNLLPIIRDYFSRQPVLRAWLFGSYSRGEETADSDIDILVDFDNSQGLVSLFTMGGILMDLSDLLGKRVDLVDNKGLMDFARKSVESDKILIYERPT
ncbi:MAG: nucleotidyltransferase [Bacteroides sp.]|nr:nucleotidyltransferase [Bacteroides sp.]